MTDEQDLGPGINWGGNFYPADPGELAMGEFELIAQRSDIKGYSDMARRMRDLDHVAWKALFWAHDRRRDPDLKWSEYMGPPMRLLIKAADTWAAELDAAEEPGKAEDPATEPAG